MGRPATVQFASLRTCLCNLPLAIHGPLAQRGIPPQSVVVELTVSGSSQPGADGAPQEPKKTKTKAYLGWSGFPSQVGSVTRNGVNGSGAGLSEVVEIDPQFGALLGLGGQGSQVTIELLRDLPVASSVSVSPLSADDWEILETNAAFVEMNLLSQVRAVSEGMIVCCWVGTTIVRFTIDGTTPPAAPAVVLTSATELLVAPKSRHTRPAQKQQQELSAKPTAADFKWDKLSNRLVRLIPQSVADALELDPPPPSEDDEQLEDDIAFVSPELHSAIVECLGPTAKCTIQHIPFPTEESGDRERREEQREGSPHPNGAGSQDDLKPKAEIRVRPHPRVPLEHIWCRQAVKEEIKPVEGWPVESGFELVKFGSPFTSAEKKQRAKDARDKEKERAKSIGSPREGQLKSVQALSSTSSRPPTSQHPPPPLAPLAGVDKELSSIKDHVIDCLLTRQICKGAAALAPAPGIVVTGLAGSGKTGLVKQVASELEQDKMALTHTIYVDCAPLADEQWPKLKEKFKLWFEQAWWHAPTLLVLDNLDKIVQAEQEHIDLSVVNHIAHLFRLAATEPLQVRPIILLATAKDSSSIHPLLSTTHILGHTVPLRGPNKTSRKDILSSILAAKTANPNLELSPELNVAGVAALSEGYLPIDLKSFVDRAIIQAAMRPTDLAQPLQLELADFVAAQKDFTPLSLQDVKLQTSTVEWGDIGGLKETRNVLRETLEWPTKYAQIFANCPLRLRSGLLLYGYPGCGKTLLASAVAKECGLNFIAVKGPEILNKYIGASEKSVRDLFDRAQAAKPCVLFFDEFDSIAPKRGHDSTGVTDRVVNQLLTQMDGAEGLDGVYVLAATSRPDLIDAALLRPGRLDKSILCGMPDDAERLDILQACTRKVKLAPEVDLGAFVASTRGFSGADLQALVYNAHLESVNAKIPAQGDSGKGKQKAGEDEKPKFTFVEVGGPVEKGVRTKAEEDALVERYETMLRNFHRQRNKERAVAEPVKAAAALPAERLIGAKHFEQALKATRPSVPREEVVRLGRIYSEFVNGRSKGGMPNGEPSDEIGGRVSLM